MAGISTTGLGLPATSGIFGSAAGAAPAAASNQAVPGFTVQGQGGATTLPSAAPADFQGSSPTPLDQPDQQYPSLIAAHVAVLRAVGTPEAVIQQFSDAQPQAEYMERWIQGELMQNPEAWDSAVGNPTGTARAALQQLLPQVQLPAPGQGHPGYLDDGSPVSGIASGIPGVSQPVTTQPILNPTTGQVQGGGGLMKGLLIAGGIAAAGFIGWKLLHKSPTDTAKTAAEAFAAGSAAAGGGGAAGGIGNSIESMGRQLMGAGMEAKDISMIHSGMSLGMLGAGGTVSESTNIAASAWGVMNHLAPGDGYVMSLHAGAKFAGISDALAHKMSLDNRWMGVMEKLAANGGTLGDAATAGVLASQAVRPGAAAAAGSAVQLDGLRQLFAGAANVLG
jgi:hypothetical protein